MKDLPEKNDRPDTPGYRHQPLLGLVNNYILLLYSVSCLLIYLYISVALFLRGHIVVSLILPAAAGIVLPLFMLTHRFNLGFLRTYRLKPPDPVLTAIILIIAAGSILPTNTLTWLFERNRPANPDYIDFLLSIKPKGAMSFLAILSGSVLVSPFGEELLFRGFIQQIFQRNMSGMFAICLSGAVFGASHFNLTYIPGITVLGMILGYIFFRTGNLLYPFFAHALLNLVSLINLNATSEETILINEMHSPSIPWLIISLVALATGIFLLEQYSAPKKKKDEGPSGPPSL